MGLKLGALGAIAVGGHVGVAGATHLAVAGGARRHALAPEAARPARPLAQVRPRVPAASHPAQPGAICKSFSFTV